MSEATQLKRFSQSPDPDALYAHLVRNYPEAEYHSVYEAGFCGFWIHYRLVGLGIHNIVVNLYPIACLRPIGSCSGDCL